jgi:hypothetical protein
MDSKELINLKIKELEGHKQRKLTKNEKSEALAEFVGEYIDGTLKEGRLLNMMQGREIANVEIRDYINDGHNLDDVKDFIERNLSKEGKDAMSKVVMGGENNG